MSQEGRTWKEQLLKRHKSASVLNHTSNYIIPFMFRADWWIWESRRRETQSLPVAWAAFIAEGQ